GAGGLDFPFRYFHHRRGQGADGGLRYSRARCTAGERGGGVMADAETLDRLYKAILDRRGADPETSYTAKLFHRGRAKIAQKLGEEAVETVIEAVAGDKEKLAEESADLLYHLLV